MLYQKLVKVLKSFDAARLRRLNKYAHSPYFGVYPPATELFDYLAALYPRFEEEQITTRLIARRIKKLSTIGKQEAAGSRLMRAIENFLAIEEFRKKESKMKRYGMLGLRELQLHEEFEKTFEKEMARLQQDGGRDLESFADKHLLTEVFFNGFDARLSHRAEQNDIMPVVRTLDEFYALKKLRYLCEALNRQQTLGVEVTYYEQHVPTLLRILEPYTNPRHPYVYLFVNVFRMLMAKSFEESEIPYRLLQQFAGAIHPQKGALQPALTESINYANSHCLRWFNAGYNEAGLEYLWWTDLKAKHHLLLDKGRLMPIYFRNIISIAVICKKNPAWIEEVIYKYAPLLPANTDEYLDFAQGLYHYSIKKYKEAIRFLLRADARDDAVFSSVIRRWQFICLYEYDPADTDALMNHLGGFEKYLLRNKRKLHHVMYPFVTFIDYSNKLLKTYQPNTWCAHFSRLQEQPHFAGKQWLLEAFAAKSKTRARQRLEIS